MQIQSYKINSLLRQSITKVEPLLEIFLASRYIHSLEFYRWEKKNRRKEKDKNREMWYLILLLELETRR